jgi:hypothetical protein
MENNIEFPVFRKLNNNRSYYNIINDREFEEIQVIGSKRKYYRHLAKQYPEILLIQDLIHFTNEGIKESNNEEWMKIANI